MAAVSAESHRLRQRLYASRHPDKIKEIRQKYAKTHPANSAVWSKAWRGKNKDRVREYKKAYPVSHREIFIKGRRRRSQKYKNKPDVKLKNALSHRVYIALKGAKKISRTMKLVGCTISELRTYLEKLFQPGMSWGNYGDWHVDHKIPCAVFDLTDPNQQAICFKFTNLQPLWGPDNIKKGAKYA